MTDHSVFSKDFNFPGQITWHSLELSIRAHDPGKNIWQNDGAIVVKIWSYQVDEVFDVLRVAFHSERWLTSKRKNEVTVLRWCNCVFATNSTELINITNHAFT